MIDPITMMLLAQAIPTAINAGKSAVQGAKANKLSKVERPQYQIPEAVKQALNQSKYIAGMNELPGQNTLENKLGQNTSRGIAELKSVSSNPSDLASNVARLYGAQNEGLQDIGIAASNQWLQNQGQYSNALNRYGAYQDKEFDINKMQPYMNAKAAESALREGSFRNLSAAGQNVASGISGYANMNYQQDMLDKILGSSNPSTSYMQSNEPVNLAQAIASPMVQDINLRTTDNTDIGGGTTQSDLDLFLQDPVRYQSMRRKIQ